MVIFACGCGEGSITIDAAETIEDDGLFFQKHPYFNNCGHEINWLRILIEQIILANKDHQLYHVVREKKKQRFQDEIDRGHIPQSALAKCFPPEEKLII